MKTEPRLSTYTEMVDVLERLPLLVREARRVRRLSQRAAAQEIGCSFATVSRIEAGDSVSQHTIVAIKVLRWLDQPPAPVTEETPR